MMDEPPPPRRKRGTVKAPGSVRAEGWAHQSCAVDTFPSSYRQAPFAILKDLARPPAGYSFLLEEGEVLVPEEVGPLGLSIHHPGRAQLGMPGWERHVRQIQL